MIDSLPALLTACLTGGCEPAPKSERPRRGDAPKGPLWSLTLPIKPGILAPVFKYAETGELTVSNVTGRMASLTGTAEGFVATVSGIAFGRPASASLTLGYGSDLERDLATGKWVPTKYGGKVLLTRLMPEVKPASYGANIYIGAEFQRPGILSWFTNGALDHLRLFPNKITPVMRRKWQTLILPDIKLVEQREP